MSDAVTRVSGLLLAASLLLTILSPVPFTVVFVIIASVCVPLLHPMVRGDRCLSVSVVLVVLAHHLVSIVNTYIVVLPGAEADAVSFHSGAAYRHYGYEVELVVGYEFYVGILGWVYRTLGGSLLLGQSLSILAFSCSILVFLHLCRALRIDRHLWLMVLMVGLWPSALLLTSFTLREAWEQLFFILFVFFGVLAIDRSLLRWGLPALLSAALLSLQHRALFAFSLQYAGLLLVFAALRSRFLASLNRTTLGLGIAVVVLTVVAGMAVLLKLGLFEWRSVSSVLEHIYAYRLQVDFLGQPRSAYRVLLDFSSWFGTMISLLKMYGYYLFGPLQVNPGSPNDLYALIEAWTRFFLILSALVTLCHARGRDLSRYAFVFAGYLTMTFIWAMGTTNTGQAVRHHVLTNWMLILLGAPAVIHWLTTRRFAPRSERGKEREQTPVESS